MKIVAIFFYLLSSKLLGLSIQATKISVQDAHIIACDSDYCELIKQFNTSENNSFDCFEENILISFWFHINNQTIDTFGYLTQGNRGLIETKQQASFICKKIRKYNYYL